MGAGETDEASLEVPSCLGVVDPASSRKRKLPFIKYNHITTLILDVIFPYLKFFQTTIYIIHTVMGISKFWPKKGANFQKESWITSIMKKSLVRNIVTKNNHKPVDRFSELALWDEFPDVKGLPCDISANLLFNSALYLSLHRKDQLKKEN